MVHESTELGSEKTQDAKWNHQLLQEHKANQGIQTTKSFLITAKHVCIKYAPY
jgi:hypothetical protein